MSKRIWKLTIQSAAVLGLVACEQQSAVPTAPVVIHMAVAGNADHGGRPYATPMTQEVTSQPPYQGDADGSGDALITLNFGQREVCWELKVANLDPAIASHIHEAGEGIRGPIVIGLSAPNSSGVSSGCRGDVDPELMKRILQSPSDFYVNVHTTVYPNSAIRGQLHK